MVLFVIEVILAVVMSALMEEVRMIVVMCF